MAEPRAKGVQAAALIQTGSDFLQGTFRFFDGHVMDACLAALRKADDANSRSSLPLLRTNGPCRRSFWNFIATWSMMLGRQIHKVSAGALGCVKSAVAFRD